MKVRKLFLYFLIGIANLLTGCTTIKSVQPWEKGNLAKIEMMMERDRLEAAYAEHTYFSKEASSGGNGVGGGGCGCN